MAPKFKANMTHLSRDWKMKTRESKKCEFSNEKIKKIATINSDKNFQAQMKRSLKQFVKLHEMGDNVLSDKLAKTALKSLSDVPRDN
jgi:glycosyltransferase A (GT-A) superfamily protein (DUF2064 family)